MLPSWPANFWGGKGSIGVLAVDRLAIDLADPLFAALNKDVFGRTKRLPAALVDAGRRVIPIYLDSRDVISADLLSLNGCAPNQHYEDRGEQRQENLKPPVSTQPVVGKKSSQVVHDVPPDLIRGRGSVNAPPQPYHSLSVLRLIVLDIFRSP